MDKYADHVHASLRDMGFHVRVDKTSKYEVGLEGGRSDLLLSLRGQSIAIENKWSAAGFKYTLSDDDSSGWRPNQRSWADWFENQIGSDYWIWLQTGKDQPQYNADKYNPRRSYLFPRKVAIEIINIIEPYQMTLPYRANKGKNKYFQANQIDCEHLLSDWQCQYIGNQRWEIPKDHLFFKKYMEANCNGNHKSDRKPVDGAGTGFGERHLQKTGVVSQRRTCRIPSSKSGHRGKRRK